MRVLAIEQSASVAGVALVDGGGVAAERAWPNERQSNARLFPAIREVLAERGLAVCDLDAVAAGVGPGSFSGVRMAVCAANALAMPAGVCVLGISAGEAVAEQVFRDLDADAVAVVGDARRNMLWRGDFVRSQAGPVQRTPWRLEHPRELARGLAGGRTAVATPDWDRLGPILEELVGPGTAILVRRPVLPAALTLARLAARRLDAGLPVAPPEPIYLHPAVAPRDVGGTALP